MDEPHVPVIAVDGPSGTGKGTLCRHLATWLHWHILDSGALYRALAIASANRRIPLDDDRRLAELAADLDVSFPGYTDEGEVSVILAGDDVSQRIRSETCARNASRIAAYPSVRSALLARQRAYREPPGLVVDGRDMGTVVFPDAEVKVFLIASQEERAARRHKQLKQKGIDVNLGQLLAAIAERDARDSQRTASPLKPAPDAIVFDTTDVDIAVMVGHVAGLVRERLPGAALP
ncbi:MAG: (d)CMP kinase [Gammaproteobacteria bacterium]|nr:(d)CMP kinase [Gammaproteobacteria bacterium]MCI0590397.1 (d)CMP kinase [Gammaproteobacteria bacterium]